jgi:predicted RecA/RadA family phage recombinase
MSVAGERVELARCQLDCGERILVGQRVNGAVALADVPAGDTGRVYWSSGVSRQG